MLRSWSPNAALAWMWQVLTGGHGVPVAPEWRDPLLNAILTGEGVETEAAMRAFVQRHMQFGDVEADYLMVNLLDDAWLRAGARFAATERRSPTELMARLRGEAPTFYEYLRRRARTAA